ncbi:MAG: SGNH/GDSL hydrolase family protein [Candidatus Omnitrophota bacterium]|jgi:hypothetical protein
MKKIIEILFIPTLVVLLLLLSVFFDYSPGFGRLQQALAFLCAIFVVLSVGLRVRPFSILAKIQFSKPKIILFVKMFIICFAAGDLLLRLMLPPVHQQTRYGWSLSENVKVEKRVEDSPGNFRDITVEYYKHGFKRWGDPETGKKKILIIGDSFSQMNFVSNGEEWYSYLERAYDGIELFVFGGGGYGSLQEFMVLDDFFDIIHPDLILWQFCGNDYGNNLYDLDVTGYPYNNHCVRPYLEDEKVVYRLPLPLSTVRNYSFVADRLLNMYDRFRWRDATRNLEAYLEAYNEKTRALSVPKKEQLQKLEERSFAVTQDILGNVRKRVGNVPIYMFNACGQLSGKEQRLCDTNQFICIENIAETVTSAEKEGLKVKVVNDGHWNRLGNELAGKKIADYFKNKL